MDSTVEDYEIILILIEDGSTDRTYEIAQDISEERIQRLKIFKNEKNLNVGISSQRAIINGIKGISFLADN